MTDCGDQSNYKVFFYQDLIGSNECYFYKYTGPEGQTGFEYEQLNNCEHVSKFCRVYSDETTGKFTLPTWKNLISIILFENLSQCSVGKSKKNCGRHGCDLHRV